jgi:hypothetical protein
MSSAQPKKRKATPKVKSQVFPAATLAFYGPDDQLATKVVVSIVLSAEEHAPVRMRKWYASRGDIRTDASVRAELMAYLQAEGVQRVVLADRIIGCPHEEGVDYPRGENCPLCPFWASHDRWTGRPIHEG